jgi:hypothetical protein
MGLSAGLAFGRQCESNAYRVIEPGKKGKRSNASLDN